MAKSVKTLFMDAIAVDLRAITEIKQVKRGPVIPVDRETAVAPFAAFTTDKVTFTNKNRLQMIEFDLAIGVLLFEEAGKDVEELADDIDALIQSKLLLTGTSLGCSDKIRHVESDVIYPTDDLETGLLYAVYHVEIHHAYGDATNRARG